MKICNKMPLYKIFQETLDSKNISNIALADAVGRSRKHISDVRNGKSSPPINEFDRYLDACEELAPGFRREFGMRITEITSVMTTPEQVIDVMTPDELSRLLFAIGDKIKSRTSSLVGCNE